MQDNAPSHSSKLFPTLEGFNGNKLMWWLPASADINPLENMWSIIKRDVCENKKQCSIKDDLWKAVKPTISDVRFKIVEKLIESMVERLLMVRDCQ